MSEENGLIICPQCGSANPSTFRFCSNCGVKLEESYASVAEQQHDDPAPAQQSETTDEPVYEKADAEIVSEGKVPLTQDELHINYGAEEEGNYSSGSYSTEYNPTPTTQYYSASDAGVSTASSKSGGNGGFAIASMICGIISILCCCLTWVSLVLGVAAVVLGIIALKYKYDGKGMAIAGIVTGGIGIFIWLIVILVSGSGFFQAFAEDLYDF